MQLQSYLCLYSISWIRILSAFMYSICTMYIYFPREYELRTFGLKVNHTTVHVHINYCRRQVKLYIQYIRLAIQVILKTFALNVQDTWNLNYSHDGVLVLSSPVTGLSGLLIGLSISHTPLPPPSPPLRESSSTLPAFSSFPFSVHFLQPHRKESRNGHKLLPKLPDSGEGHESPPEGV